MTRTEPVAALEAGADVELVRLAQTGDKDAFGSLVERNRRAVYRAAYAALGSASEADDVVQDAFVTAFQRLSSYRGESSFKTWVLSIAWRKALDRRRSLKRWMRLTVTRDGFPEEPSDMIERVASGERSHDDRLAGDELTRQLKRLVGALPRKLRDALLLAGSGEHSYEEIGKMLSIPVGTVKWRVSEARRVLKKKLSALGCVYE